MLDPANPTQIIDSKTTSNNKDGGAFHSIISGGGGSGNKCILSVTGSTISASATQGRGGLYFCQGASGTSSQTVTITSSTIDDSKASSNSGTRNGGAFFIDVSGSISFSTSASTLNN